MLIPRRHGKCFRLYSERVFEAMENESVPEIRRTNLASTVLAIKAMGIADVLQFRFIDPPDDTAIIDALKLLYWLAALDDRGAITPLGRCIAELPLDPPVARYARDCLHSAFTVQRSDRLDGLRVFG